MCLLGIVALVATSCDDGALSPELVVGNQFTDSNLRVVSVDTMTVESSTMKFDSIVTSQATRMLIGKYTDPVFGSVSSSSYAEFLPSTYIIDSEAEYDSIAFFLKYDQYYYSDTLQQNTIHIKRINERLRPDNGDDFYNTTIISYLEEDLGNIGYPPRPLGSDSLEIKLDDGFGIELFENLQDQTISNSNQLTESFKGLAFLPDYADNGSVLGFSLGSSLMRLYFSKAEEDERVQDYIDFTINMTGDPAPFFNQIASEGPNEYINGLTNQETNLSSSESENQSYVQSGIGITTRIQFPHVRSIFDIPGQGTILDAVLKIKPTEASYSDLLILRDVMSVFIVDQNNDLTEQLFIADIAPVQAILNRDGEEFNDIYYEIPLGSYIERLLDSERDTEEALILLPDDYNSTVDRFVLNGNKSVDFQTTLELTYVIYDEDE